MKYITQAGVLGKGYVMNNTETLML